MGWARASGSGNRELERGREEEGGCRERTEGERDPRVLPTSNCFAVLWPVRFPRQSSVHFWTRHHHHPPEGIAKRRALSLHPAAPCLPNWLIVSAIRAGSTKSASILCLRQARNLKLQSTNEVGGHPRARPPLPQYPHPLRT